MNWGVHATRLGPVFGHDESMIRVGGVSPMPPIRVNLKSLREFTGISERLQASDARIALELSPQELTELLMLEDAPNTFGGATPAQHGQDLRFVSDKIEWIILMEPVQFSSLPDSDRLQRMIEVFSSANAAFPKAVLLWSSPDWSRPRGDSGSLSILLLDEVCKALGFQPTRCGVETVCNWSEPNVLGYDHLDYQSLWEVLESRGYRTSLVRPLRGFDANQEEWLWVDFPKPQVKIVSVEQDLKQALEKALTQEKLDASLVPIAHRLYRLMAEQESSLSFFLDKRRYFLEPLIQARAGDRATALLEILDLEQARRVIIDSKRKQVVFADALFLAKQEWSESRPSGADSLEQEDEIHKYPILRSTIGLLKALRPDWVWVSLRSPEKVEHWARAWQSTPALTRENVLAMAERTAQHFTRESTQLSESVSVDY